MRTFAVVDDFQLQGAVLEKMLSGASFQLEYLGQAMTGEEGLKLAREKQPDLIFVDIEMPGMDGLSMSAQLRKELPNTKLVILTAHDEFRYAQQALRLQVDDYLLKPIAAGELKTLIQRILDEEAAARHSDPEEHQEALMQELVDAIVYGDENTLDDCIAKVRLAWERTSQPPKERSEKFYRLAFAVSRHLEGKADTPELLQPVYQNFVQRYRVDDPWESCADLFQQTLRDFSHVFRREESSDSGLYICRAKNWIHEHLDEDITLISLSAAVFLSPSHLSRLFKRYEGVNFSEYLRRERLEMACRLLRNTSKSVEEIARSCGYDKGNSFGKMFKKEIGLSPSQYREQQQETQ